MQDILALRKFTLINIERKIMKKKFICMFLMLTLTLGMTSIFAFADTGSTYSTGAVGFTTKRVSATPSLSLYKKNPVAVGSLLPMSPVIPSNTLVLINLV